MQLTPPYYTPSNVGGASGRIERVRAWMDPGALIHGGGAGEMKFGVKRARREGGLRAPCCSVDGCASDLGLLKDYHRRHKVCEVHSKTPLVLVGGQQQRFCQQCSRFHLLGEFDELKRSCRKRLDGHNKRRRKPKPLSSSPVLVPSPQGPGFHSHRQVICLGTELPQPDRQAAVVNDEYLHLKNHSRLYFDCSQQLATSSIYRGRQFSFLRDSSVDGSSSFQSLGSTISSSEFCDCITCRISPRSLTQDFKCPRAPSLLSSPNQYSAFDLYHIVPAVNRIQSVLPSTVLYKHPCSQVLKSQTYSSCSDVDTEHAGDDLVPDANKVHLSPPCIFSASGGDSSDGPFQAVPFSSWWS